MRLETDEEDSVAEYTVQSMDVRSYAEFGNWHIDRFLLFFLYDWDIVLRSVQFFQSSQSLCGSLLEPVGHRSFVSYELYTAFSQYRSD